MADAIQHERTSIAAHTKNAMAALQATEAEARAVQTRVQEQHNQMALTQRAVGQIDREIAAQQAHNAQKATIVQRLGDYNRHTTDEVESWRTPA